MVTALWNPQQTSIVTLRTRDSFLATARRVGKQGIDVRTVPAVNQRVVIEVGPVPTYVVGELAFDSSLQARTAWGSQDVFVGERDILHLTYRAGQDLAGGTLWFEVPSGWPSPQLDSPEQAGFVSLQPGPLVALGKVEVVGRSIAIEVVSMQPGDELRLDYGDTAKLVDGAAEPLAFLFDLGDESMGPISDATLKMQPIMFWMVGAPEGFIYNSLPAVGFAVADNGLEDLHRDMAVSVDPDLDLAGEPWMFATQVARPGRYQVRVFVNGGSPLDRMLDEQTISVNGSPALDSSSDRVFRDIVPERYEGYERMIVADLQPDVHNSVGQLLPDVPSQIPDNVPVRHVYGIEILHQDIGAGPPADSLLGRAVFRACEQPADDLAREILAYVRVRRR
jgi:hypothetical protein